MSSYPLPELLRKWALGELTAEQAIGQLLQHLLAQAHQLAALEKLVARGEIRPSERVVVVSTANGLKFTDFKVQYHERKLPNVPNPKYANTPILLPNDYVAIRDEVRRRLDS